MTRFTSFLHQIGIFDILANSDTDIQDIVSHKLPLSEQGVPCRYQPHSKLAAKIHLFASGFLSAIPEGIGSLEDCQVYEAYFQNEVWTTRICGGNSGSLAVRGLYHE